MSTPKTNPVGWFEIPVTDMSRAKTFYEKILGYTLTTHEMGPMKMAWFPFDEKLPGCPGSLIQGEGYIPCHKGSMVYFGVESIEETCSKISAAGGKVLQPKTGIGEYGFIAHFEDSEGNRVSLHSPT